MDRKKFITNTLALGTLAATAPVAMIKANNVRLKKSSYDALIKNVGYNHLPNKENKTMNTVLHKAATRGKANHGWLNSNHTFSFANYHNPDRMNFGALRVLNDDVVANGRGFNTHPHDNMEIISIPLYGDLEHKDSMGNTAVIKEGDIQVLSAGTGMFHSEYNKNQDKEVRFLQIWVFPNKKEVKPRYDQIAISAIEEKNTFSQILSPDSNDQGVWIHQDTWFHIGNFDTDTSSTYQLKKEGNGIYAFILEGEATINGQKLEKRDGYGLWNTPNIDLVTSKNSKVLLMEVPMQF